MQGLRTNLPKVNSLQELFSPWQCHGSETSDVLTVREEPLPVVAAVSEQKPDKIPTDPYFP